LSGLFHIIQTASHFTPSLTETHHTYTSTTPTIPTHLKPPPKSTMSYWYCCTSTPFPLFSLIHMLTLNLQANVAMARTMVPSPLNAQVATHTHAAPVAQPPARTTPSTHTWHSRRQASHTPPHPSPTSTNMDTYTSAQDTTMSSLRMAKNIAGRAVNVVVIIAVRMTLGVRLVRIIGDRGVARCMW
jgi:hypothetical protein